MSSLTQQVAEGSFQKYLNNELSKPFSKLLRETEKPRKKSFHVSNLVYRLQSVFTLRTRNSFFKLLAHAITQPRFKTAKTLELRNIQSILDLHVQQQKLKAIRKWQEATFKMSLQMARIHKRLKARLLLSLAAPLQPKLDLTTAISRWKVKADKNITRFAIARFANNIKINPLTALWKLKGCLTDGERRRRKQEYLDKINRALTVLTGIMSMLMKANNAWAFGHIQAYAYKRWMALKLIQKLEERFNNLKRIALNRWRDKIIEKDLKVTRRIMGNFVRDMRKNMIVAIHRWRLCTVAMKLDYEKRLQLAMQKLAVFVTLKTELLNIEAFHEIAREDRRQALLEHIFVRDKAEVNDGAKILAILIEKHHLVLKHHAFTKLLAFRRDSKPEHEEAARKIAIIGNSGLRDAFFKLKFLIARENEKSANELVKRMFLICQGALKANTVTIFDTEREFKRTAALKYEIILVINFSLL